MNKLPQSNLKRASKNSKSRKKQPLKVVYITNPIMFKTNCASEFRALVQEFTGKYAETPEYYSDSPVADGGGEAVEAVKVAYEDDDNMRCASALDREIEMGHDYSCCDHMMMMNGYDNMVQQIGSDHAVFDPFHENHFKDDPKIFEGVKGLEGSSLCRPSIVNET